MVAFIRMVEDNIEDHLNAGGMEGLNHVAKLVDVGAGLRTGAKAVMGSEIANGAIAPVVNELFTIVFLDDLLAIKTEHRQELDSGDSQLLQIGNLLDHTRKGTWMRDSTGGTLGKATNMHLIDDGFRHRDLQRLIVFPVIVIDINNHTAHAGVKIVDAILASISSPPERGAVPFRVGINQHFGTVEAMAISVIVRPINPIGVTHARGDPFNEDMPKVKGLVIDGIQRVRSTRLEV